MSYWISETLKSQRTAAGIDEGDLARVLGVSDNTIRRLEKEESFDRNTIDTYVAGYAYLLGLDDPRELWQIALRRWEAEGAAPEFKPPEGPLEVFARAIRDQAQRHRQSRGEPTGTQTATQRKRADR